MICPKCGCRLLWTDGAYCQACMSVVDTRIQRRMGEREPAGGGNSAPNPPCTPPSHSERPADLTRRCEGCGEYLTAQGAASHCRTGGYGREGNPWPEACGPIHCLMCNDAGGYVSLPGDAISPCPYCSEKHSTRLTAEAVGRGSKDSAPVDDDGERS